MEITEPHVFQPSLKKDRLRQPGGEEPVVPGTVSEPPVTDDPSAPTASPVVDEGGDEGEASIQSFGLFSVQMFYGRYGYPNMNCVVFSNKNANSGGPGSVNRRLCLTAEATEGTALTVDKSMMEAIGLFDTEDGDEDAMKYITTGPGMWLVMSISHSKEPYVIKPQSMINLADKKDDVAGLVTSIGVHTGAQIIVEVVGKVEKKNMNKNCFAVYGKNPWDNPSSKGLMMCSQWVSGDPFTISFSEEIIELSGHKLSDYNGGVSFILVGSGIGEVHGYTGPDISGDKLEVHRNTVFDFADEKNWDFMDKKIRSFDIVFVSE